MHCIVDLCPWLPPRAQRSPQRPQLAPLLGPFLSEAARRATALNRLKTGYGLQAPQKADSEIFNKFGPASIAAGVPCVIMTSCPMDSWR